MYDVFEHTADLGLRVEAASLNELFAEAGEALCSIIVENLEDVRPAVDVRVELTGSDREYLFFDWLNELLYQFESKHLLLRQFEVQVNDDGLTANARGETLDPARHRPDHEVKAITYHGLKVEATAAGWRAEVIVDI